MKKIDVATTELSALLTRHQKLKEIFSTFQRSIIHIQGNGFPVKSIKVDHVSDIKTNVSFMGRAYELNFSSTMVEGSLKGKISVLRTLDENNTYEVTKITYNGESLADVEAPQGEDPILLNEDSCCINLVCNWILSDIKK